MDVVDRTDVSGDAAPNTWAAGQPNPALAPPPLGPSKSPFDDDGTINLGSDSPPEPLPTDWVPPERPLPPTALGESAAGLVGLDPAAKAAIEEMTKPPEAAPETGSLMGHPLGPPSTPSFEPLGQIEHLEEVIKAFDPGGSPAHDLLGIPSDLAPPEPEIVPNPEPRYGPDEPAQLGPTSAPSPMPGPYPGQVRQVLGGTEPSMIPELVAEPDAMTLASEQPYDEPGIWNPDPISEPGPAPGLPHDEDLA